MSQTPSSEGEDQNAGSTDQQQPCTHYWIVESPTPKRKWVNQDCKLCGESKVVPAYFPDDQQFSQVNHARFYLNRGQK